MKRPFVRFTALLILPGLLLDPATADLSCARSSHLIMHRPFSAEALSNRLTLSGHLFWGRPRHTARSETFRSVSAPRARRPVDKRSWLRRMLRRATSVGFIPFLLSGFRPVG